MLTLYFEKFVLQLSIYDVRVLKSNFPSLNKMQNNFNFILNEEMLLTKLANNFLLPCNLLFSALR